MNKAKSKIIVLVAPSGAGKTTIARRLLKEYPGIKFSISATTRAPRGYETDGEDYYFLTDREFNEKIDHNDFLEWETYNKKRYGTLRSEVDKMMESGYFPLLDIEVKGALNIQEIYASDCITIFIKPPSIEELKRRLVQRGSEDESVLEGRLNQARIEMEFFDQFNHCVINDDLDTAYQEVTKLIEPFIKQ